MRNFARLCLAGVAVACSALLLSGCVQPHPVVTPPGASNSKPLFASDEDALAAATKAYAAYLQMSDLILSEGGRDPSRIEPLAIGKALKGDLKSFQIFRKNNYRSVGASSFTNPVLQRSPEPESGGADVVIYLCLELAGVDVVDASGVSVVSPSRPDRQAFEVAFNRSSVAERSLVVSSTDDWPGSGICI